MRQYFGLFFDGNGQAVALFAVALVWLGFSALGAAIGGRNRLAAIDHLIGWTLVSFVFTLAGVFIKVPFTPLAWTVGAIAVGAGVYAWRRDRTLLSPGIGRMLAVGLPLLLLASAMRASQWDEFTDWLMIPRYLLETDGFPNRANPFSRATFAGYPYNWHLVGYLAGRVAGGLVECAGALSNLLLLFGFGLLIARLILMGAGRVPEGERMTWPLVALALLLVTLVNPTFAQKIVLTAYAETATAVATGTAMVLGWMVLDALASREFDRARRLAWSMGLVLALLINLKQATLVLAALVMLATAFVALRDPAVPAARFVRLLPAIVLPAAVIFATWRYHLSQELTVHELSIRPIGQWSIDLIPRIVANMLTVLAKKGYFLGLAAVLVAAGALGFWRARDAFDRLAALAAMVVLGYNAFLLFAYISTFGPTDALRVASYWRYNMHLGGVIVAFTAYGGARLWCERLRHRVPVRRLAWFPMVLVVIAPLAFAQKLRFDHNPDILRFRAVGIAVSALVQPEDNIYNIDPTGSGESTAALSFEIGERARLAGQISAFDGDRVSMFGRALSRPEVNALVVHSWLPGFAEKLGVELIPGRSYFLRRKPDGGWQTVNSWPASAAR